MIAPGEMIEQEQQNTAQPQEKQSIFVKENESKV